MHRRIHSFVSMKSYSMTVLPYHHITKYKTVMYSLRTPSNHNSFYDFSYSLISIISHTNKSSPQSMHSKYFMSPKK